MPTKYIVALMYSRDDEDAWPTLYYTTQGRDTVNEAIRDVEPILRGCMVDFPPVMYYIDDDEEFYDWDSYFNKHPLSTVEELEHFLDLATMKQDSAEFSVIPVNVD